MTEPLPYADLTAVLDRVQVGEPRVFKVTHPQWKILLRRLPRDANPSWPSVAPLLGVPVQFVDRVEDSTLHELGWTVTLPDPTVPNEGAARVVLCAPDQQLMAELATAGTPGVEIRVSQLIEPGSLVAICPQQADDELSHWHLTNWRTP